MDVMWNDALQGVTPAIGGVPVPPATYRLRIFSGEGKLNSSKNVMMTLGFEIASGPLAGRKIYHNENLPKDSSDNAKTRMAFFLGLLAAFGLTGEQLGQMFSGRPIDEQSVDYLAKMLVSSGRTVKATASLQSNDETRNNWRGWAPDDGIEPEPPKQTQAAPAGPPGAFGPPTSPNGFGGPPAGPPQNFQQAPAPQGLPLGGFPGSAQPGGIPAAEPAWATQQPVQGQPPQQMPPGPGQFAPAAQPQAAGLNQFAQTPQDQFPGQQFPGQVNPAQFPPQNQQAAAQPQQGFQQPAGLPGQLPPAQPQQAPAGLPQGGFPVGGQPPQGNI
jgi:uncharacterized protein DUF669